MSAAPAWLGPGWAARLGLFRRGEAVTLACELCGAPMARAHPHLLDTREDEVVCACPACAEHAGNRPRSHYRPLPSQAEVLSRLEVTGADWAALEVPIGLAFFLRREAGAPVVALYPGPTGLTESHPDPESWAGIETRNPGLRDMAPGTEAAVISMLDDRPRAFRLPADRCYALAGEIRSRWDGLGGGAGTWARVRGFLDQLDREVERCRG
ncbi:MAG TPA: DUF5947 family protein [Gammaproteobacteria bacterium]|nr:DUF5947 family protein [Gammaproteobacteria bacterium]